MVVVEVIHVADKEDMVIMEEAVEAVEIAVVMVVLVSVPLASRKSAAVPA